MKMLTAESLLEVFKQTETYDEQIRVRQTFHHMHTMGFISFDAIAEFYDKCGAYYRARRVEA